MKAFPVLAAALVANFSCRAAPADLERFSIAPATNAPID
jgi:hypothetical protein